MRNADQPESLTFILEALPEKRRELARALQILGNELRGNPHCLHSKVEVAEEGMTPFHFHTVWADRAALEDYRRSNEFHVLYGACSILANRFTVLHLSGDLGLSQASLPFRPHLFPDLQQPSP